MSRIQIRTVRDKLLLMVLAANFCTLITAGSALLYHDVQENRHKTVNELTMLADILGQGSIAALEFDDAKVAKESLLQLRANPNIVVAAIYTVQGVLFAHYVRDQNTENQLPSFPELEGFRFGVETLSVFKRIGSQDVPVGTIYLKARHELSEWLRDYLLILGAVLLFALGLGFAISSRLQRWISNPIMAVSAVARQVMEQRNFQLRATKSTEDEIGQLAEAFNGMLQTLEHEIAERSAAEQEVRMLNTALEQRVAERTLELQAANRQLMARTEEAEAANRAKANFLANMSHEIRTPMNAVLGLAYLLDQTQLDQNAADLVKKIRNAGRSLQSIINDILDFSKIEAGRLDIEQVPFHLVDVLDNLAGIMSANAGDKELELVLCPPPELPGQLLGDALRLEQVLINLTSNAIKFTDQGSVIVGITLLARDEKAVQLRFSVKDSGIGIPQEQHTQIFNAFAQADISTTRRFGGTGLGLTICRLLVTKMGGEIGVISEPGKGSEFWFTVPFGLSNAASYALNGTSALDVLVVDDSELARENLALTAQSVGWNATKAESGAVALQKIQAKRAAKGAFNVLLIDWKMPGMDGLEVATKIRNNYHDDVAPIVLMVTAFARDELLQQADIAAVDGILNKPVTSSALYNTVSEVLRRRGQGGAGHLESLGRVKGKRILGVRVLVVDDSEINREVAMRILMAEGATVSQAENGQVAINWLCAHPNAVDVVLMDIQMPVMDGYEATRQLRLKQEFSELPIIALTAGAFKAQKEAARQSGMNAFVAKPFDVEELISSILQLSELPELPVEPGTGEMTAAQSQRATMCSDYADLPGIAINKGLQVWHDLADYSKFLSKFALDYADCHALLVDYLATQNLSAASALLHKLKGASANMALVEVARCAAALEALILDGEDNKQLYAPALNDLHSALATAFASIALFVVTTASTNNAPPTAQIRHDSHAPPPRDKQQIAKLLAELLAALDTDTPDRANLLLDELAAAFPPNTLTSIRSCIDNFDFRGAEARVYQLAKQSGIQLQE